MAKKITNESFHFYTVSNIAELTGLEAANLKQLVAQLKTVSLDSVFYHTHKFLREHLYTGGAFTNDFAYWTGAHTPYKVLSEKLANIDILCFTDLAELRNTLQIIRVTHHRVQLDKRVHLALLALLLFGRLLLFVLPCGAVL